MYTKNYKFKIILAIVCILIAGVITVGIFSNNEVSAGNTVPNCPACSSNSNMELKSYTDTQHIYECTLHTRNDNSRRSYL